jgi:hypothetical protein
MYELVLLNMNLIKFTQPSFHSVCACQKKIFGYSVCTERALLQNLLWKSIYTSTISKRDSLLKQFDQVLKRFYLQSDEPKHHHFCCNRREILLWRIVKIILELTFSPESTLGIAISVLVVLLFGGAGVFTSVEGLHYGDAVYFCFVTLATIGRF